MTRDVKSPLLFAFILLSSCAISDDATKQSFVTRLIQNYEADSEEASPDEIWSFMIGDDVVFYVRPMCCNILSTLYDKEGNILCHPDGGITGAGDGQCPDFHKERSTGVLVWRDPRIIREQPPR